jgi:D-aminopeptidase
MSGQGSDGSRRHALRRYAAAAALALGLWAAATSAAPRARDLGIPFDGTPGTLNAITDVAGVSVGVVTLISGDTGSPPGSGPVRTGVTAILPRGRASLTQPAFAAVSVLNGTGEMTGTHWLTESGLLYGPVLLTNTHSVGVVRDAAIAWNLKQMAAPSAEPPWALPIVAETWDGWLNDINGFHVHAEHVYTALESASTGPVPEGSVGGGTGMICFGFKCGLGTSSRVVPVAGRSYTIGVLLQSNFGRREQLRIAGIPVAPAIPEAIPYSSLTPRAELGDVGSIVAIVATDAPLLPHQLRRLARRVDLAIGRLGGVAMNESGDLFLAFSTANAAVSATAGTVPLDMLANEEIDPLFSATIQAAEEAIVNALVAGRSMTGIDGHTVMGLPHDRLRALLRRHGRLLETAAPAR